MFGAVLRPGPTLPPLSELPLPCRRKSPCPPCVDGEHWAPSSFPTHHFLQKKITGDERDCTTRNHHRTALSRSPACCPRASSCLQFHGLPPTQDVQKAVKTQAPELHHLWCMQGACGHPTLGSLKPRQAGLERLGGL